jgi:hypothetical protein
MRIEAAAGRDIVVVAHHPLRHPPSVCHRARPTGAETALAVMRRLGVRAVLSGHLHGSGVPPGAPPVMITGSSLSYRLHGEPNAWSLVELGEGLPRRHLRIAQNAHWMAAP